MSGSMREARGRENKRVLMEKGHRRRQDKAEEVLSQEEIQERERLRKNDVRRRLPPKKPPHPVLDVTYKSRRPMRPSKHHKWEECIAEIDRILVWESHEGYIPQVDEWLFIPECAMFDEGIRDYLKENPLKGFGMFPGKSAKVRLPERTIDFWARMRKQGTHDEAWSFYLHRRSSVWRMIYERKHRKDRNMALDFALLDTYMLWGTPDPDLRAIEKVRAGKYANETGNGSRQLSLKAITKTMDELTRVYRSGHQGPPKVLLGEMFPDEVVWALKHLHLIEDPARPATWRIGPDQAPDDAHWNLVMLAAMEPHLFIETICKLMSLYHKIRTQAEWKLRMAEMDAVFRESRERQRHAEELKQAQEAWMKADAREKAAKAKALESEINKAVRFMQEAEREKAAFVSDRLSDEQRKIDELKELWGKQ